MKALELPSNADLLRLYTGFAWDFTEYVSGDLWTTLASDSGTVALQDSSPPEVLISPSDGTVADNDETYIHTTKELFLFADGRPIIVEVRLQFAEQNTDDANIIFGLMSGVAADALQDNGAGPAASYSGALFFKEDGETVWSVENSIAGTQKTTQLTSDNSESGDDETAGQSAFQTLRVESRPVTSTKHDVLFFRDGKLVAKHKDQSYSSATEMAVIIGAKNGGGNHEQLNVQYCFAYQLRT